MHKLATQKLILVSQLLQKYQMMFDRPPHCGMLPIGNAILFGGLLHNPSQRSIVSVAHKRAQMMDYMVVESASKPTNERVSRGIVGRCREDVIDPVVKLAAVQGKVSAVDRMCGLEYKGYGQTDDQMGKHESQSDQQRRFPQQHYRQNKHVGEIESFTCKQDGVFSHRMLRVFQIIVGWEEKTLKVPQEHIVERK